MIITIFKFKPMNKKEKAKYILAKKNSIEQKRIEKLEEIF